MSADFSERDGSPHRGGERGVEAFCAVSWKKRDKAMEKGLLFLEPMLAIKKIGARRGKRSCQNRGCLLKPDKREISAEELFSYRGTVQRVAGGIG